ncbi:MAG: hypothetical protein ACLU9S_08450 [Oscillospiraceae bacterium]
MVTDRTGTVLLDATDGRVYSADRTLRMATLHLLGDREGWHQRSRPCPGTGGQMVGFDLPEWGLLHRRNRRHGCACISAKAGRPRRRPWMAAKGVVAVHNYKTGEILCAVSSPTYDPDDVPGSGGRQHYGEYDKAPM